MQIPSCLEPMQEILVNDDAAEGAMQEYARLMDVYPEQVARLEEAQTAFPVAVTGGSLPPQVTSTEAYDLMCQSIELMDSMKEAKDIIGKSAMLAELARRMNNDDAQNKAMGIRLVATRRFGELCEHLEKNGAGRPETIVPTVGAINSKAPKAPSEYTKALKDAGVSTQEASIAKALAKIPQEKVDAARAAPKVPSPRKLVEAEKPETIVPTVGAINSDEPVGRPPLDKSLLAAAKVAMKEISMSLDSAWKKESIAPKTLYGELFIDTTFSSLGNCDATLEVVKQRKCYSQACVVGLNDELGSEWCQSLLAISSAICHVKSTEDTYPGLWVAYVGARNVEFAEAFKSLGAVFQ